jgi:ATP-dependent protease ClpP protease subunit
VSSFRARLACCPPGEPLTVEIDSSGGDSCAAKEIAGMILRHPARTETLVAGVCAGSAMLVAVASRKVRMARAAAIVLPSGSGFDETEDFVVWLAARRWIHSQKIIRWMSTRTWFDAYQSLACGLIDEISYSTIGRAVRIPGNVSRPTI